MVEAGDTLVKIPRAIGKSGDITGGLPRVTEPLKPVTHIATEIDGEVTYGKIKRGNREISITQKPVRQRNILYRYQNRYLYRRSYVRAGTALSDGAITPSDILAIKGPTKVQEYICNRIRELYRLRV